MGDLGLVQETEVKVVILIYCSGIVAVHLNIIILLFIFHVEIFQILLCLLWGISTSPAIFSFDQQSRITFSREFRNILGFTEI